MASLKSRVEHAYTSTALRSYLAEFISTFFFVFASVGSKMASHKIMEDTNSYPSSLVASAIANAFALSVAVYISVNISGGHVNPAVTFGMAIVGRITAPMAIMYGATQLLGSVMACLVLKVTTVSQPVPLHTIPYEMTGFGAGVLEGVMSFAVVYTAFASADPRKGGLGAIGPLAIGFIFGANALASTPFTGGYMNPAYSFGAAYMGGSFRDHVVYWAGPMIGGAIAAIIYEHLVFPTVGPDPPRADNSDADDGVL